MCNLLPALHYADNSGLRFIVTVCRNPFVRLLILLLRLFGLYLIDFYAVLGMRKVEVHSEYIARVDVLALGTLTQESVSSAGKGLKCSLQFDIIWDQSAMPAH